MHTSCSIYTASNPAPTTCSSTSRASIAMPGALRLEDLQDFPPPRTYIAEQVYNVPSPTVLYLDLAPSPTQSHALPPSTTTGSPNAYFVSLFEPRALPRGGGNRGDRSTMAGPSMAGWWYCCHDNNLNNPDLCGERCTTCGHGICASCSVLR